MLDNNNTVIVTKARNSQNFQTQEDEESKLFLYKEENEAWKEPSVESHSWQQQGPTWNATFSHAGTPLGSAS